MVKINSKQHITKNGVVKSNPIKLGIPKTINKKDEFGEKLNYKLSFITNKNVVYQETLQDPTAILLGNLKNGKVERLKEWSSDDSLYLDIVEEAYRNNSFVWLSSDMKYNLNEMEKDGMFEVI